MLLAFPADRQEQAAGKPAVASSNGSTVDIPAEHEVAQGEITGFSAFTAGATLVGNCLLWCQQ